MIAGLTLDQRLKTTLAGNCDVFKTTLSIPYNHAAATTFLVYDLFKPSFKDPGGAVRECRHDYFAPLFRCRR